MIVHHRFILDQFKQAAKNPQNCNTLKMSGANYSGSPRKTLHLKNSIQKQILKDWAKKQKNITYDELISLLDLLIKGDYKQERSAVGFLLALFKSHKRNLSLDKIDQWLDHLAGWEEIDNLCQSTFDEKDLLPRWPEWERLLRQLNQSENISKRRASLVLVIKTLRSNQDKRVVGLALANIDNLKHEKDILITKAISWLLREMIKLHRTQVIHYLARNRDSLPKIAVREVERKLTTGRK